MADPYRRVLEPRESAASRRLRQIARDGGDGPSGGGGGSWGTITGTLSNQTDLVAEFDQRARTAAAVAYFVDS
jgi:hypothetical protein